MANRRALVVDDDEPIRTLLATIVEHQGYAVDTANDGEQAIDRIDADGYSLVLLDLMMPRVDGYTVLRHIRDSRPDLLRCTIIASAVPERDILNKVSDQVFRIHIKPFDMTRLIGDIRSCSVPVS
jgi:DNA-binding response OmpR family regulator